MPNLPCKEFGCQSYVNTTLGCIDVTSLLSLRLMLENQLGNVITDTDFFKEQTDHLNTINRQLEKLLPEGPNRQFDLFKKRKETGKEGPVISQLYLTCHNANGKHSHIYDVNC